MPEPEVREGGIVLHVPARPPGSRGPGTVGEGPFYNPAMRFNRDLSVRFVQARLDASRPDRPFRIYDGLAASGARGLRFAKECAPQPDQPFEVVCNDRDPEAAERIRHHAALNDVARRIEVREDDFAYGFRGERFDHVEIDPFGSPMPFVDAALRHVRRGGTVAATATDVAALCGVHPNACRRRYDAEPWHGPGMHEVALRILAGALVRHAARFDRAARPVLMHATDHYLRVYLEVQEGARRADAALDHIGYAVEHADGTRTTAPRGAPRPADARRWAGPLWTGPLHDRDTVSAVQRAGPDHAAEDPAVERFLAFAAEEAEAAPLLYEFGELARAAVANAPPRDLLIERLRAAGHGAARSHLEPAAVKTDAPYPRLLALFGKPPDIPNS